MAEFKNTIINDTGFITFPSGTSNQRPTNPSAGMIRFNTDEGITEYFDGFDWVNGLITIANPTNTTLEPSFETFQWSRSRNNTNYETPFTYTFPNNTPLGHYYLVVWNDYRNSNTNPSASTAYRTRRVFSLHVVNSYDFSSRTATAADVPSVSGSGGFEHIEGVNITNTTRSQLMTSVNPGSAVDVQYHTNDQTVMVVPGDSIEISVLLQGPYREYLQWSHNAV